MILESSNRPTRVPRAWPALSLALMAAALLLLPACRKKDEGPGHASADATDSDGHAHARGDAEHADEVKLTPEAVAHYAVRLAEARMWMLKPTFIAPARVGFNIEAMAHVGSPLRGRAVDIKVRLGDQVKKNDALVVIESPELGQAQADFLLKRTAAEAAAPQVDLARAAWDRARGLLETSEGISLTDVQRREAEYKAAVAAQKTAASAATAAENGLHILGMDQSAVAQLAASGEIMPRYTIRAAIDGQVVQRELTLGELVGPDRESLLVLADTSTLWVLADVPEARLPMVATGAKAWVTLGTAAGPLAGSADRRRKFEGEVAFIAPLVDSTTRTAQVRIEVPSAALARGALRPGMFAQVEIVESAEDGQDPAPRVAVPQEAVQIVEGGPAVFVPVPNEPDTFQKRPLTVGRAVGGLVPVFSGLVEGEAYVEAGSFILKAELGKRSAAHEH